ncbi:hypothetical protein BOTBODRAFT_29431 [Botryobasidium botryosum FD-172 SS1]|uniref:BD-FAE-like domain-containing protein n=1 Tax=Botryobasidium botryosum (strain FD-172 SS1) TaxID=930990 RepID=A0A067MTS4_BOTB1|nr:hypothetical protein BOTBODRAFT_29431 [Botryobasidium botryosum FD-172 SS1]
MPPMSTLLGSSAGLAYDRARPDDAQLTYVLCGDPSPRVLVVFVHGGAWRSGDKAKHAYLVQQLAARAPGCAVAAVNYRLSPRVSPDPATGYELHHPAHAADILTALEYFVSAHPHDVATRPWKIAPSCLVLVGHSCGAHILTSLFLRDPHSDERISPSPALVSRVSGIVAVDGIYDIDLLLQTFPSYIDFIQGAFGSRQSYASVSTTTFDILAPAIKWLVVHSPGDDLVDVAQAEAISRTLSTLYLRHGKPENVESDYITVTAGHDALLDSDAFISLVVDFVRRAATSGGATGSGTSYNSAAE